MEDSGSRIYFLGEASITHILREIMEFLEGKWNEPDVIILHTHILKIWKLDVDNKIILR